jgi:hypothetical protein
MVVLSGDRGPTPIVNTDRVERLWAVDRPGHDKRNAKTASLRHTSRAGALTRAATSSGGGTRTHNLTVNSRSLCH